MNKNMPKNLNIKASSDDLVNVMEDRDAHIDAYNSLNLKVSNESMMYRPQSKMSRNPVLKANPSANAYKKGPLKYKVAKRNISK